MNTINLTTELCAEDRARIDKLTATLEKVAAGLSSVGTPYAIGVDLANEPSYTNNRVPSPEKNERKPLDEAPVDPDSCNVTLEEHEDFVEVVVPDEPAAPQHTKAELQQKVVSLVSAGKKEEVKEIIKQYAAKVSEVPAEKVDEVWDKLEQLEEVQDNV